MVQLRMTYYPDITQKQSPQGIRDAVVAFGDLMGISLTKRLETQVSITVPPVMNVPEQYQDILCGQTPIALMKPVTYVFAHHQNPEVVPACVAHRPIDGKVGNFYFAQVYARADLKFKTLADLESFGAGKLRIAYGDRFSTSNFLIPAGMLQKAGVNPFLFFKNVNFAGGHDFAAEAVYKGEADIGAGHDGVIKILAETNPDAESKLVRLERENIHSDPVVVNKAALPVGITLEDIQHACVEAAATERGKLALDLFWGWVKDLSPTEHKNYASIESALDGLHLKVTDMV
jgi:ABC-type phosphate/phosphonate transport system substrate-binding protein